MTSFEFTWKNKSGESAPGKVFGRKKIINKTENSKDLNSNLSRFKKSVIRPGTSPVNQTKFTQKKISRKIISLSTRAEPQLFIKRKGKKDKLASKNAIQDSKGDDVIKTNERTESNLHTLFSEKYKNSYINTNVKGKSIVEKVFSAGKRFGDMEIHKHIVSNLEKNNFNILTNVQEKSLPVILSGQNVLIRSQTGSGKTLAYAVPILNALQGISPRIQRNDGVQAIIVVPTRELALQAHELFVKLNTFQWIVVGHLCGGENRKTEKDRLRKGVHILIATPGRLLDHILHTTAFNVKHVRCLVLDEADRLLDMGFKKDIVRIVEELDSHKKHAAYDPMALLRGSKLEDVKEEFSLLRDDIPPLQNPKSDARQTLLLSATLSKEIAELANFTMKDHVYIDALDESFTMNPQHMIIPHTVKQEFILTFIKHRLVMLSALLISKSKQNCKTFVFMATGQMVDFHYELFKNYLLKMPRSRGKMKMGEVPLLDHLDLEISDDEEDTLDIELFKLHGSMNQNDRKDVFNGFRKAKKGVLLCTDVAARGLDVPEADSIIQYTGPQSDDDYLHRVGRTGRAGKSGSAIIFLTHEEQEFVSRLQDHKVFLKEHNVQDYTKNLCIFMEQPDNERATLALQKRYEAAISKDKELYRKACFAYSSWSRFYSSVPTKMKSIFDFKKINLGHYVTSFGLQETPTTIAKIVRGQVTKTEPKRLNKKLANHEISNEPKRAPQKRLIKSLSLMTSEFSSGIEPVKKRRKKKLDS